MISARGLTRCVRTGTGDELTILNGINLDLWPGRITAAVGPNAIGKTTLARAMAGIDPLTAGTIQRAKRLDGRPLCGMVFQEVDESMLPWRSNLRNASFGLEAQGMARARATHKVRSFLEEQGIALPCDKYPLRSSGGERQMVAVVRAAVTRPMALILDEPFSRIDPTLLGRWRRFIRDYAQKTDTAVLFVSHSIGDVLEVADDVAVVSSSAAEGSSVGLQIEIQAPVSRGQSWRESRQYLEYLASILKAIDEAHTK